MSTLSQFVGLTSTQSTQLSNCDTTISSRASPSSQMTGIIKSIQRGTINLTSASSGTATISSVTTSKAVLYFLGYDSNNDYIPDAAVRLSLTNSTTITANKNGSTGIAAVNWQVVEYY